jgi:hypothetical protein
MTTTQTPSRPASLNEYEERLRQVQRPIVAESTQRGLTYQVRPSDVFISPYGKCGTTWLQQIVHGLRTRGDMDFDDISRVIPWLEMAHRLGLDPNAPQRGAFRAFKSHLSWQRIPKGGRYIVSFRDPKDALVSAYHFLSGWHWQPGAISLTEYARRFYLSGTAGSQENSYWDHFVSWWEQRNNPHVLLLTYEGMKADLPTTVETIAGFLGIELDPPLYDTVVEQASLAFMVAHRPKFSDPLQQAAAAREGLWPPGEVTSKVRNGQVGAHQSELPADIAVELDVRWRDYVEPRTGLSSYQAVQAALA